MKNNHPASFRRLVIISVAFGAALNAFAQSAPAVTATAGDAPLTLEKFVVSASRSPQDPMFVPSSVTALSLPALEAAQIVDLRTALATQPGLFLSNTGAVGGQSSVFLRGASSHQTLFMVDGVRMNDRSTAYSNFLGGADLSGVGRIEVLRGPQSTLYGSSAMGGVIVVDTTRGCGAPSGVMSASVGSLDTYSSAVALQGGTRTIGYSGSVGYYQTANDRTANDFDQWSYSTRLEYAPSDTVLVGATYRGQQGEFEEPGSRLFASKAIVESENQLLTAYGQVRPLENLTSRLTVAQHRRDYAYTTFGAFGSVSESHNRRNVADWQNTWTASKMMEVVAGANLEQSRYLVNGAKTEDDIAAGYLSATVRARTDLSLTAGVRYDDFDSFGAATTGRAGVAWLPAKGMKLRATYGTGFTAPGSDDRYGVPSWGQLANPALRPEKSRGWDFGFDQQLFNDRVTLGVTYFKNQFRNLFEWETVNFVTYEGRIVNRAHASTDGVEVAVNTQLCTSTKARVAYTYLEAKNDDTGARLTRRPRHTFDGELITQVTKAWELGGGVHFVADRLNGKVSVEDYTTARLFAGYAYNDKLKFKLRVENALDEAYEEVFGYPSLPRTVTATVEWRF